MTTTADLEAADRAWQSRRAATIDQEAVQSKRLRFLIAASAERQGLEVVPVLQQFQLWGYFSWDIAEMLSWPPETIDQHAALLSAEAAAQFGRYP